jgi:hypothetical protein
MLWILFVTAAAIHVAILAATLRLRAGVTEWLLRALLLGLITDNLIVAAGAFAIDESWYYGASWMRYLAHVLLLPPMAFAALVLLQRAGSRFAVSQLARIATIFFVAAAISFGFVTEIAELELVRETVLGHPRMSSTHSGPPLATIATNLVILGLAAMLWRTVRWPWLFAAALFIFLVNGAAATTDWGIIAGNLAEVVFVLGWFASIRRFRFS